MHKAAYHWKFWMKLSMSNFLIKWFIHHLLTFSHLHTFRVIFWLLFSLMLCELIQNFEKMFGDAYTK